MDPDDDVQGTLYAYSGCLQRRFGWYLPRAFRGTVGAFHTLGALDGSILLPP